jgi:glutathione S-transferase
MITLYHGPRSRSSRIIWLLEELGAPYELKITNIVRMMEGTGEPDPNNPHPDKKVPAIVHEGALITESAAICLYLTDAFPQNGVGPRVGEPLRGEYLTWLFYYAGVIEPIMTLEFAKLGDHPMVQRTWAGRAALDARILGALNKGPYVLGERFSAADVLVGSMGHWARQMLPAGGLVDEYLARLSARPAMARAMARDAG